MCVCLHFCKRKILLIMLLQVNIKNLIIFSAQTPRFDHIKNEKLSMKMNFFSKKKSSTFFVYKINIPKKWQIPLSLENCSPAYPGTPSVLRPATKHHQKIGDYVGV